MKEKQKNKQKINHVHKSRTTKTLLGQNLEGSGRGVIDSCWKGLRRTRKNIS
jgi:hypothetical protein